MTETQNLEEKTKTETEKIKSISDDCYLMNCEECGCLITSNVYNLHKKQDNKGVCGICLGLTPYSRQLKEMLRNKK
jgi:hypothetical protein